MVRRAKKRPNIARLSGFRTRDVGPALKSYGLVPEKPKTADNFIRKAKTEEEKIRLRAAGYKVEE